MNTVQGAPEVSAASGTAEAQTAGPKSIEEGGAESALERLIGGGNDVHAHFDESRSAAVQDGELQQLGPAYWALSYEACRRLISGSGVDTEGTYVEFFGGAVGSLFRLQQDWLETARGTEHSRRRLIAKTPFSTSSVVAHLLAASDRAINHSVERLMAGGRYEGDYAADFAQPLGRTILLDWLGLPRALDDEFASAVAAVGKTVGQPLDATSPLVLDVTSRLDQLLPKLERLAREGELRPGLAQALRDTNSAAQEPLSPAEFAAHLVNFAFDSELLEPQVGTAMMEMLTEAKEHQSVFALGEKSDALVWELLRMGTGSPLLLRQTSEDVTVGDVTVPANHWVVLYMAAALRDPLVYSNPHVADLSRRPTALVFGAGDHTCLGGRLAFKVLQSVLSSWFGQANIELDHIEWMRGPYRGVQELHLVATAR